MIFKIACFLFLITYIHGIEKFKKIHNNLRKKTEYDIDLSKIIEKTIFDYSNEGVYENDGNKNNTLLDKNINCIIFYYTYVEPKQRKDGKDIISFEHYYDFWKPNDLQWVCDLLYKKYIN
jgi:hypothetical protein